LIRRRTGRVLSVTGTGPGLEKLLVRVDGAFAQAINYPALTGPAHPGDAVLLNTGAVHLGLGTGGYHFVQAVWPGAATGPSPKLVKPGPSGSDPPGPGHIMKLRYTPAQLRVLAVEEEAHPRAGQYREATGLDGIPVIIGSVHSMVAPAAATLHYLTGGRVRLVYLMTDAAALPLWFSETVADLRRQGLVAGTVTCGHAFGGDLEAVNVYSGLLAARAVLGADAVIAAMGPGLVGTGTKYGHTALEQGQLVDAVNLLGGLPVAQLRLSFADPRFRHRGVSHHSLTALGEIARTAALVALPCLPAPCRKVVLSQLKKAGLLRKHRVQLVRTDAVTRAMGCYRLDYRTMGRAPAQDPFFFQAAGAAAVLAAGHLQA